METRRRLSIIIADGELRDTSGTRLTGRCCCSPLGDSERGLVGRLRRERRGGSQSVWKTWKLKAVFSAASGALSQTEEDISASPTFRVWPCQTCQTNQRRPQKKKPCFCPFLPVCCPGRQRWRILAGREQHRCQTRCITQLSCSLSELNSSWTHYLFVLTINGPLCCSLTQFPSIYIQQIDEWRLTDLLTIYRRQLFLPCAADVSVKVIFTSL